MIVLKKFTVRLVLFCCVSVYGGFSTSAFAQGDAKEPDAIFDFPDKHIRGLAKLAREKYTTVTLGHGGRFPAESAEQLGRPLVEFAFERSAVVDGVISAGLEMCGMGRKKLNARFGELLSASDLFSGRQIFYLNFLRGVAIGVTSKGIEKEKAACTDQIRRRNLKNRELSINKLKYLLETIVPKYSPSMPVEPPSVPLSDPVASPAQLTLLGVLKAIPQG